MKERIKAIRKNSDLSQTEFGKRIGTKRSAVTAYEAGTRVPSAAVIMMICRVFGVNKEWLINGNGPMYVESTSDTLDKIALRYSASPVFRRMLDVYARLTADQQAQVENVVDILYTASLTFTPVSEIRLTDQIKSAVGILPDLEQAE